MTLAELYNSVAQLGFEDSLGDDGADRFIYAANRALLQVNALRPATSSYILNHRPPPNILGDGYDKIYEKRDETLSFEANGAKAYYFEVCGEGRAEILIHRSVRDNSGARSDEYVSDVRGVIDFNTDGFKVFKGLIKYDDKFTTDYADTENVKYSGTVIIKFSGTYAYTIRNLAMYDTVFSSSIDRIPEYGEFVRYDISQRVPDFLALGSNPVIIDEINEKLDKGYHVENGKVLILPYDRPGTYRVEYQRKPRAIQDTGGAELDDTTALDLDEDLCALLPILIASYVWLDDEPEKAQYYLSLYQAQAAEIEFKKQNNAPVEFKSVYGW